METGVTCQHRASPVFFPRQPAARLIPLAKISNFTDREGNDVREGPPDAAQNRGQA